MENDAQDTTENKILQSSPELKTTDFPNGPIDFKQELAQFSELNGKYEESNKMFVCHLCDFRTAFRNSLLNHQAVHSDSRPWVCSMCDYAAKRKQDLKKHLHTIHGVMVESTMLKPVGLNLSPSIGMANKSLSREESSEDNSCDIGNEKNKSLSLVDPTAFYPHMVNDNTPLVSVKQELQDKASPYSCQANLPSMSNFVQKNARESPDLDLPLSFPSISFAKTSVTSHSEFSKNNTGEDYAFSIEQFPSNSIRDKPFSETPPHNFSYKPNRKRTHSSIHDTQAALQESMYPFDRHISKNTDSDEHHPCSSSSATGSSQNKDSQTQATFMCEHCDIMFFQRAMYLMHIGLHSPEDPWCCAVCGFSFTEKYSFTSHFINQH